MCSQHVDIWGRDLTSLFHDTIKMIGDENGASESALVVKTLLLKLETQCNENFIPHMATDC